MPVTNEQLISEWAEAEGYQGFELDHSAVLRNLAKWLDRKKDTDLLDARATIETQSTLLKEMREYIETCIVYEGIGKFRFNPDQNKQEALIERTKEFV